MGGMKYWNGFSFSIIIRDIYIQSITNMNNFQDGAYTFWKAKWEQALASDANALDDLKIHVQEHTGQ